jgi:hypothetical protein
MVEVLCGYCNRREPLVVVLGGVEIVVRVAAVNRESVTLAPIDGSRRYHCHPHAVIVRDAEPIGEA